MLASTTARHANGVAPAPCLSTSLVYLRARLLPPTRFANVDVANASKQLVAVHAGYVSTEREKLRRLRVWRGQEPANAPRELTSSWPV